MDTTPPSAPQGLSLLQNLGNSVEISWNASDDLSGISGYEVYSNGAYIATTASTAFMDTGLTQGQLYDYTMAAIDASKNRSVASEKLQVTTRDIDPPSVPTNLAYVPSSGSALITWDSSTDNVALAGYKIYQDGVYLCTVTQNEYSASSLFPNVYYLFSVSAVDAAGNESEKAEFTVKTNTPPIASAGPDQIKGYMKGLIQSCNLLFSWPRLKIVG